MKMKLLDVNTEAVVMEFTSLEFRILTSVIYTANIQRRTIDMSIYGLSPEEISEQSDKFRHIQEEIIQRLSEQR